METIEEILSSLIGFIVLSVCMKLFFSPRKTIVENNEDMIVIKEGAIKYLFLSLFILFGLIGTIFVFQIRKTVDIAGPIAFYLVALTGLYLYFAANSKTLIYEKGKFKYQKMLSPEKTFTSADVEKAISRTDSITFILKDGTKIKINQTFDNYNEIQYIIKNDNIKEEM